jgi:hypothetical protein
MIIRYTFASIFAATLVALGVAMASAASPPAPHRNLVCCDGTSSPSCTCEGPRNGCCSHHGGVCDSC